MGQGSRKNTNCILVLFFRNQWITCKYLFLSISHHLTDVEVFQKGVMISHYNVIANILQIATYERPYRDAKKQPGDKYSPPEVALGLLPHSHIYSLVVICHATIYRGDQIINLPRFEMTQFLSAVERFRINILFVVSF